MFSDIIVSIKLSDASLTNFNLDSVSSFSPLTPFDILPDLSSIRIISSLPFVVFDSLYGKAFTSNVTSAFLPYSRLLSSSPYIFVAFLDISIFPPSSKAFTNPKIDNAERNTKQIEYNIFDVFLFLLILYSLILS